MLEPYHDRMPVILRESDLATWLDPHIQQEQRLLDLLAPLDPAKMSARRVSRLVNSPKNSSPDYSPSDSFCSARSPILSHFSLSHLRMTPSACKYSATESRRVWLNRQASAQSFAEVSMSLSLDRIVRTRVQPARCAMISLTRRSTSRQDISSQPCVVRSDSIA